ncbi:hypothetical protein BU17DRAFT_50935, partial [Hysterangium stoloniferum]
KGNAEGLVWDGNCFIDLDYGYTSMGKLPCYIHSLSFPPSYIIRLNANQLCQLDISPGVRDHTECTLVAG